MVLGRAVIYTVIDPPYFGSVELVEITLADGDRCEGSRTSVSELPSAIRGRGSRPTSAHDRFADLAERADHAVTKAMKMFALDPVQYYFRASFFCYLSF